MTHAAMDDAAKHLAGITPGLLLLAFSIDMFWVTAELVPAALERAAAFF